jgi:hypothetical protein
MPSFKILTSLAIVDQKHRKHAANSKLHKVSQTCAVSLSADRKRSQLADDNGEELS